MLSKSALKKKKKKADKETKQQVKSSRPKPLPYMLNHLPFSSPKLQKHTPKKELESIADSAKKRANALDFLSYSSPHQSNENLISGTERQVSAMAYRKYLLRDRPIRTRNGMRGVGASTRSQSATGLKILQEGCARDNVEDVEKEIEGLMEEFRKLESAVQKMEDVEVLEENFGVAKNKLAGKEKTLEKFKKKVETAKNLAKLKEQKSSKKSNSLRSPKTPQKSNSVAGSPNASANSLPGDNSLKRKFSSRLRRLSSRSKSQSLDGIENIGEFDQDFWQCFNVNPQEAVQTVQMDLERVQDEFEKASEEYSKCETLLQERRVFDCRLSDIMDRFYGQEPGYENDPVNARMLEEAKELSETGREAEKARRHLLKLHQQVLIALRDQENALDAAHTALQIFKEIVQHLKESRTYNRIDVFTEGTLSRSASLRVKELWQEADKKTADANRKAKLANYWSRDAPVIRTVQVGRNPIIGTLDIVYDSVPVDMMVRQSVTKAFEKSVHAYTDSEKTVKYLEEFSARVRSHLHECKAEIERHDRVLLQERSDIFYRNHPQEKKYPAACSGSVRTVALQH